MGLRTACSLVAAISLQLAIIFLPLAAARRFAEWQPQDWGCSPANTLNKHCPKHLQGDSRCTSEVCPALAGCVPETCHAFQGNVKPDQLIALDAYAVKGEKCIRQAFSISECCSLCKHTKDCNAWSYCNTPEGCGTTCDPVRHAFSWYSLPQPWDDIDPADHPSRLNPGHACTDAGGFPYGTCSLKIVKSEQLAHPVLEEGGPSGWVSGVVSAGSVAAIDPVAFVLETDTTQEKTDSGTSSLGGLMEDDESRASAAEDSDDILIPPSTPSRRNAARQSNSSWLLRALSYGVGLLLATWPYAAL